MDPNWWEEDLCTFAIAAGPGEQEQEHRDVHLVAAPCTGSGVLPPAVWERIVMHLQDIPVLGRLMCTSRFFAQKSDYDNKAIVRAQRSMSV